MSDQVSGAIGKGISGSKAVKVKVSDGGKATKRGLCKFGQFIGIPGIGRKPQKLELEHLQSLVAARQPDQQATLLNKLLEESLKRLYAKDDREGSIKHAVKTAELVRAGLDEIDERRKQQREHQKKLEPSSQDLKAEKNTRETLEKALAEANKLIPKDLGDFRFAQPGTNLADLQTESEIISRAIGSGSLLTEETPGITRASTLETRITTFRNQVGVATTTLSDAKIYLQGPVAQALRQGQSMLETFNEEVQGTYKGPLVPALETLRSQVGTKPVRIPTLANLVGQILKIQQDAGVDDTYVATTHGNAVQSEQSDDLSRTLNELLKPHSSLFLSLNDFNTPEARQALVDLNELRLSVARPIPTDQLQGVKDGLPARAKLVVDAATKARAEAAETLENEARLVQESLVDALMRFRKAQKEHGDRDLVEADIKMIEAQLGSATDIIPEKGVPPPLLTKADIDLARAIVSEARTALLGIEAKSEKVTAFETDVKELKKQVSERGIVGFFKHDPKQLLEKHDPKRRAELQKKLEAMIKAMPSTPSKTTLETFEALQLELKTALDELEPAVALMEGDATKQLSAMKQDMWEWLEEGEPVTKAYADALDALEKAVKAKPPVQTKLADALQKATTAADDFNKLTPEQRAEAVGTENKAAKETEAANKKRRAEERGKLRPFLGRIEAAGSAVERVDGDKPALATIERLRDQIESNIAANAFDKLDSLRSDLEIRLERLLQNPAGEQNRRRSELPAILQELRVTAERAAEAVTATSGLIAGHDTGDQPPAPRDTAANLLKAYAAILATGIDDVANAAKPLNDTKRQDEDSRRAARETSLRLLAAYKAKLQSHPLSQSLLAAPFPPAKAALAPLFRAIGKLEYTLTTSI